MWVSKTGVKSCFLRTGKCAFPNSTFFTLWSFSHASTHTHTLTFSLNGKWKWASLIPSREIVIVPSIRSDRVDALLLRHRKVNCQLTSWRDPLNAINIKSTLGQPVLMLPIVCGHNCSSNHRQQLYCELKLSLLSSYVRRVGTGAGQCQPMLSQPADRILSLSLSLKSLKRREAPSFEEDSRYLCRWVLLADCLVASLTDWLTEWPTA